MKARNGDVTKPASMSVIAQATGYSTATVSHALNDSGRVSPETRERIRAVAREYGYETPRRRRSKKGRALAVVLSANIHEDQTPNYYVGELLAGVESAASARGIEVMIGFWDEQRPTILTNRSLRGVLYLGGDFDAEEVRRVPLTGVTVGSYLPGCLTPAVLADNRIGTYLATLALIDSGCQELAFVNGQIDAPTSGDKYLGFRDALLKSGLPFKPDRVHHANFSISGGLKAGRRLFSADPHVDGIVTGDDPIAMGVIQAAWQHGIQIPEDVSIIGYGNSVMSREAEPALSTVHVDRRRMSKLAVDLLSSQEASFPQEAHRILLQPSVVHRETTRTVNAGQEQE